MLEQERSSPPIVRWSAVLAGTVIALGAGTVVGMLWLALAYNSHHHLFYQHLDWWIGGTAIFAMVLAGFVAGAASGTRSPTTGLLTGLTTWGLVVVGILAIGVPTVLATSNTTVLHLGPRSITVRTLRWWPTFWSLLIGFFAAAIGGVIGGMLPTRSVIGSHQAGTSAARRSHNGHLAEEETAVEQPVG